VRAEDERSAVWPETSAGNRSGARLQRQRSTDGTIVTFTEAYNGDQSTVDVPLNTELGRYKWPSITEQPSQSRAELSLGIKFVGKSDHVTVYTIRLHSRLYGGSGFASAQATVRVDQEIWKVSGPCQSKPEQQ